KVAPIPKSAVMIRHITITAAATGTASSSLRVAKATRKASTVPAHERRNTMRTETPLQNVASNRGSIGMPHSFEHAPGPLRAGGCTSTRTPPRIHDQHRPPPSALQSPQIHNDLGALEEAGPTSHPADGFNHLPKRNRHDVLNCSLHGNESPRSSCL